MALMLGSFMGGLWQGASTVMSLASSYQQYQQNALQLQAAQSQIGDYINQNVPGYQGTGGPPTPIHIEPGDQSQNQQLQQQLVGGATPSQQPRGQPGYQSPAGLPPTGATTPPAQGGPAGGGGGGGAGGGGGGGGPATAPAGGGKTTGITTDAGTQTYQPPGSPAGATGPPLTKEQVWYQKGLSDASIRQNQDIATRQANKLAQGPVGAIPTGGTFNAAGVQGPAGTQSGAAATPPPAPSVPVVQEGQTVPTVGQRLQQIGGYLYDQTGRLVGQANQMGRGAQVPPGGMYGGVVPGSGAAAQQPAQAVPDMSNQGRTPALVQVPQAGQAPPFNAAGVQGAPGTPSGPAQTPAQRNPPMLPWPAPAATPGAPAQAPAQGTTPPAGGPGLNLSPQVVGQGGPMTGLLAALSPANWVSSAQAAEPTPGPAPQPSATGALTPPAATVGASSTQQTPGQAAAAHPVADTTKAQAANANARAGTSSKVGGVTSVTAQAPSGTPPVTTAPVVKQQEGPTTTSETPVRTPAAPPVNPGPWQEIQQKDPELAQMIQRAVDKYGNGMVTVQQVAAHKIRESGMGRDSRDGDAGERGIMQVLPSTFQSSSGGREPTGDFDPHTTQGSLNQGVVVLSRLGETLGANTIQTNAAYMRGRWGPEVWNAMQSGDPAKIRAVLAENKQATGFLHNMYPQIDDFSQSFPGAVGSRRDANGNMVAVDRTQMLNETMQAMRHPDTFLQTISSWTPTGLGLSNGWRGTQALAEAAALSRGNYSALPVIQQFFAQQSHMGALSHMYAADQAMLNGDVHGAAANLAQAYAFFPDGAAGRVAVDKSGQLWLEHYSENTGQALGPPVNITRDMIAENMMMLQNPMNYQNALLARRKEVAQIEETQAHASYYRNVLSSREGVAEAQIESREAIAEEKMRSAEAIAAARREADEAKQQNRAADETLGQKINDEVKKDYTSDPATGETGVMAKNLPPEAIEQVSSIDTALRYPPNMGGAGMAPMAAASTARQIANGSLVPRLLRSQDGSARIGFFRKGTEDDPNAAPVTAVRPDIGDRFITPYVKLRGPPQPRGAVGPQAAIGPVGSGANSPMMAMSGGGTSFGGIPMTPMPQDQQQQAA